MLWLIEFFSNSLNKKYASILQSHAEGNYFKSYKDFKSLHTMFSLPLTKKPFCFISIRFPIFFLNWHPFDAPQNCYNYKHNLNSFHFCNKGEGFININTFNFWKPFGHQIDFIPCHRTINIILDFVYPFITH